MDFEYSPIPQLEGRILSMSSNNHCSYIVHDNGVHDFILETDSRIGVDVVISTLRELFEDAESHEMLRIIVDMHKPKNPPLLYAFEQVMILYQNFPNHPPLRICYVYEKALTKLLTATYASAVSPAERVERKFMPHDYRESAMEWVLAD